MSNLFLDAVRQRVVVYDGSVGATILNRQLSVEDYGGKEGCNEHLVFCNPTIVEGIHADFLEAGADVLETDTFGGSLIKLEEYGLGERTYELNRAAAELARRVADSYSTGAKPRFVAGSIGPTGLLPASEDPMLGQHRFEQIVEQFLDQIRGLVDGGSDVLIVETVQDILELKAAIVAALRVREEGRQSVPIQASITLDTSGRMLLGTDIAAALAIIEQFPVDIIGLNCSTGPEHMREPARYLGEHSTRPVSIIPNAGIPINVNGLAVFPLEPDPMAKQLREMVEGFSVGIVGGCCGSSPDHIAALVRELDLRPTTFGVTDRVVGAAAPGRPRPDAIPVDDAGTVNDGGSARDASSAIDRDGADHGRPPFAPLEGRLGAAPTPSVATSNGSNAEPVPAPTAVGATDPAVGAAAPGRPWSDGNLVDEHDTVPHTVHANADHTPRPDHADTHHGRPRGAAPTHSAGSPNGSVDDTAWHHRPVAPRPKERLANIASMIRSVELCQVPAPLIVGERLNTQGSRKVKRLALTDDYDGMLNVAQQQLEEGAHALDVCLALTERADEVEMMRLLVKKLGLNVEAPLVIDSTEADVIKAALEQYPGRAIVNSINMENGRIRIESVMPHVVANGAAVIALTIDEVGMAKTADRKLEVAKVIHRIVTEEYGLQPQDLIFDALTFTLATGDPEFINSAVETIEGIKRIEAELPGVMTILGVSNVSFGLSPAARKVLNAVFLYHCVQAGLDLAIVHPSHVVPLGEIAAEERELAEDLVFNRRPDALQRYIEHFEGRTETQETSGVDPFAGMDVFQRLHTRILTRKKEGVEADIDQAVVEAGDPVKVLNETLLPAMKEVGDKFGAGELILPFVLQSAEVMKKAVAQLETYLEKQEGVTKGTVVLATVYGDVHDIGKNLVNTILTNNGYTVHDLGKQVPVSRIIDKAVEVNATAIGLSALLVSTSKQMPLCVKELHHQGLEFPVIIGGAAINRPYAHRTLFVEDDLPYPPGVFYAKDAFEGLSLMDTIIDPTTRSDLVEKTVRTARKAMEKPGRDSFSVPSTTFEGVRSAIEPLAEPPTPPFWGVRQLDDIALADVWPHLDLKTLFRLHWGGKGVKDEAWERLQAEEFLPRLARMQAEAEESGWLAPAVRYGYWPVNADGNDLVVFDPVDQDRELLRFDFPRQTARERLCLADYFLPLSAGKRDVVSFQIVTMGSAADERSAALQAAGEYSESYFSHGLSVQAAEGMAELIHQRVRKELGIGEETGKRYSWGYPSCPDLSHHRHVDTLLDLRAIGIELTDGFQFIPEQTTAAIVVHHPAAKYYALTGTGAADRAAAGTDAEGGTAMDAPTDVSLEAEELVGAAD